VIRASGKAALLAVFGWTAPQFYRTLTRDWLGTQATHVDKLARVWPGYVRVWRDIGLPLDGARVWVLEGGWTLFPFLANYLTTGSGGVVTNRDAKLIDRYLARSVGGALDYDLPSSEARRRTVEAMRWAPDVASAVAMLRGTLFEDIDPSGIPLASDSIDLCHSGGTLEHYRPASLEAFLGEAFRILRPGAVMSHVVDHRDHLHHADQSWPFMRHLALSDPVYTAAFGHPLLYHNRLLPGEIEAAFMAAGFRKIAIRRMILPSRRWVENPLEGTAGIERSQLAHRFRAATDEDLHTAAAHYIFRKPSEI
jgi:SAM-dependent methyltransferase